MYFRKRLKAGILSILVSGLLSLFPLTAPTALAEDTQPSGVSEDASAALARMSKTLQAKEFSFKSRTFRAYVGPNGELLHIAHATKTVFRRPDRLSVDINGDDGQIRKQGGQILGVDLPKLHKELEASRDYLFSAAGVELDLFRA
jgi:hypothetical protein